MLITLIPIGIFIFFLIMSLFHTYGEEYFFGAILSGIIAAIIGLAVIFTIIFANQDSLIKFEQYENLCTRLELKDSNDVNLYSEITDWNVDYIKYKTGSESIWLSWFYPEKVIEDVSTIEYEIP